MTSTPIKEAFSGKGSGPYSKAIKCMVVAVGETITYRGRDKEEKQCLNVAVSDGDQVVKVIIYDQGKFRYFKVGQCVSLRETVRRNDQGSSSLVVTRNSKVFMSAPFEVPENHETMGQTIVFPPPAEQVTIIEALASPAKKTCSVAGKILQEDAIKTVSVYGTEVPIKSICLEDGTGTTKLTMWRDLSSLNIRPGQYIKITDVVTNHYNGETTLQTTSRSKVEETELPNTEKTVIVIGISVNGSYSELLLDDEDSIITVCSEILQTALTTTENPHPDIETAAASGPLSLKLTMQGNDVVTVQKI